MRIGLGFSLHFAPAISLAYVVSSVCQPCLAAVTLPDETFAYPKQLSAVLLDIEQHSFESAVVRMQSLIELHGSELSRSEDSGLLSVDHFFADIPASDHVAMMRRYDAKFGDVANQALSRVLSKSDCRPQDLYTVAKRFPFSSAAVNALAQASSRAADQGDLTSARAFYSLATSHGWHADAAAQVRDAKTAETDETDRAGPFGNSGPLPFDAPWFNLPTGFERDKIFPTGSGEFAFVAGDYGVLALRSDGTVAWRWLAGSSNISQPRFQPGSTNRGRLIVPAALNNVAGQSEILVVSESSDNDRTGGMTGLRASDGRLLWSTNADPLLRGIVFLGSPAVAGRYVYAVGLETTGNGLNSASLQLLAVDVINGHPLWHTQMASINTNQGTHDLDLYRDQSPPAITTGGVIVTPNIGAVFYIDRFDGELQWIRPYRQAVIGDNAVRKYIDQRHRGRNLIAPLAWTDLLRWNCTPFSAGSVVLSAPQDTVAVMGLDLTTGKLLWESGNMPQATPVGIADNKLILSGASITAVDPNTGQKIWTFTPAPGVRLTGPAIVRDGQILVRSTAGLLTVSASDSSSKPSESTTDFHSIAASEAGKAALAGAGINAAFGIPTGR